MNEVIEYLTTEGRRKILEVYRPDSCIASTRIGMDVLRAHGAKPYPVAVKLDIFNHAARQAMEEGWTEAETLAAGAKIIGVDGTGKLAQGTGWDGHLVLGLVDAAGLEIVVDLSLDQFARPAAGIHVEATAFPVPEGWPLAWTQGDPPYSVVYQKIRSRAYRSAPDWEANRHVHAGIVKAILADIPPNPR